MRLLVTVVVLMSLVLAACAPSGQPLQGNKATIPQANETTDAKDVETNTTAETAPDLSSLDINITSGLASFKSPELQAGDRTKYNVTIISGGQKNSYIREYTVTRTVLDTVPCLAIEQNSTVPEELTTRTLWCSGKKYKQVWFPRAHDYGDAQFLGRDQYWIDQSIRGFSDYDFQELHRIEVPAGKFWTLKSEQALSGKTTTTWASPEVPGLRSGMVKQETVTPDSTTTIELIEFSFG